MPNPTGKGGFQDHPENRSNGTWDKNNSFSYWMNFFKSLSVEAFRDYEKTKTEDERTVAESLAYARVHNSRSDLKEFEVVANRTEGMPRQPVEHSGGDSPIRFRSYSDKELDDTIGKIIEKHVTAGKRNNAAGKPRKKAKKSK